tara:strand:+ start:47 stop:604 length:558 start_codon:yes stop_codon:yes gene_type:complete
MAKNTDKQFDDVIEKCRSVFISKARDYGTSWRIFRLPSITDQIFIKAKRIRTLDETGINKIGESQESEYIGIINYCIMAIIQSNLNKDAPEDIPVNDLEPIYDKIVADTKALMNEKNHDYGEAWRDMRMTSFSDMLLVRLKRIKQIESNDGETQVSEGIEANYQDMINYAIFALIKLNENNENLS